MRVSPFGLPQSSTSSRRSQRSIQGVSIVEVLVSAVLLVIVVLGTIGVMRINAQTSSLGRVNQFTNGRIVADIEEARALANNFCFEGGRIGVEPLDSECISSDGRETPLKEVCRSGNFAAEIEGWLTRETNWDQNGWRLNGTGLAQGSRIERRLNPSSPPTPSTVFVAEYRDRDNNNRLVKRAEIIPPAVGYCPCSADNPITRDASGVTVCR